MLCNAERGKQSARWLRADKEEEKKKEYAGVGSVDRSLLAEGRIELAVRDLHI